MANTWKRVIALLLIAAASTFLTVAESAGAVRAAERSSHMRLDVALHNGVGELTPSQQRHLRGAPGIGEVSAESKALTPPQRVSLREALGISVELPGTEELTRLQWRILERALGIKGDSAGEVLLSEKDFDEHG